MGELGLIQLGDTESERLLKIGSYAFAEAAFRPEVDMSIMLTEGRKIVDRPRIQVDFNELVESDVVLLSKTNRIVDSAGHEILLTEGMPVFVYEYNRYADGTEEYLLADGLAELNDITVNGEWSKAAKWCCRINEQGVRLETS